MEFRVFYTCYETDDTVHAETPFATDRDSMIGMALQMLRAEGDFFGIIDQNDVTLQFMVQGDGLIRMEVPVPAKQGVFGREIALADLEPILLSVSPPFDPTRMDGMCFESW